MEVNKATKDRRCTFKLVRAYTWAPIHLPTLADPAHAISAVSAGRMGQNISAIYTTCKLQADDPHLADEEY